MYNKSADKDYKTEKDYFMNYEVELKNYLERVKESYANEFTDAEKLACHSYSNGLLFIFEVYDRKHPEDNYEIDLLDDNATDLFNNLFDKILYNIMINENERLDKKYSLDKQNEMLDNYYNEINV